MRPRVAVLHHRRSYFPLDLHQAVGGAVELLWVLSEEPGDDGSTRRLLRRLGTVVDVVGLDVDEAASELARHRPEGIVTFVDDNLLEAAALAAHLGLRYHTPEVAAVLADKGRQRAAFERAGIPGPRYWPIPGGVAAEELDRLAERVTYPAVLKHAHGSGSRDMHLIETPKELREVLTGGGSTPETGRVLEEYLPDDADRDPRFASYLSVESVANAGHVSHVAITGRFPLAEPFRETGNFIPALLPDGQRAAVLGMVSEAIAALELTTAVVHTEIKLTPAGPRLIEVNGRLAARPPFILQRVSDVNLFLEACLLAAGSSTGVDGLAECAGVGYWLMLQPPVRARLVTGIEGLNEVAQAPGVETVRLGRRPGDAVDWREGTDGNVVTVRGRVEDHDALARTIELIGKTVHVDYAE